MQRKELLDALGIVKPGLANREMIEQSTSFAFMDGRVVTYNDEISISHPIKGLDVEGAIRADELYQLLSKINKDEIDFVTRDSEVILKSGKIAAGFSLEEKIELPLEEIGDLGKWKKMPTSLLEALRFTMFSCSRDMSSPLLTCVNVRKDGLVESSDNWRFTQHQGDKLPIRTFLIPATTVQDLVRYDVTKIASGRGWVHFATAEGTVFSCRTFEGEFPSGADLLDVKGVEITLPKSIGDMLDRATVFSKRGHVLDEMVTVTLAKKKLKVFGQGDSGWFEESANVKYSGDPIAFSISPTFLKDIVIKHRACILGDNRMKFVGEGWEHVMALKAEEE